MMWIFKMFRFRETKWEVAWKYGEPEFDPFTETLGPTQEIICTREFGFSDKEKEELVADGAEGFYYRNEIDI
jgi:hypothetical protein